MISHDHRKQKYYAGIGARETPLAIQDHMTRIARTLNARDYVLRSGGARGADIAFMRGSAGQSDIYLPFSGFNGLRFGTVCGHEGWMREIAADHHPAWDDLTDTGKMLHTRNVAQILGHRSQAPISEFVICWTPNGESGGGTGQAIRIAATYGVPVYDLAKPGVLEVQAWLK